MAKVVCELIVKALLIFFIAEVLKRLKLLIFMGGSLPGKQPAKATTTMTREYLTHD